MIRLILFICCLSGFSLSDGYALAPPDLVQQQVVDFARSANIKLNLANEGIASNNRDIGQIDEVSRLNHEGIKEIIRLLNDFGMSPCAVREELEKERPQDLKRMRYVLNDLLEERTRWFQLADEQLAQRIAGNRTVSQKNREEIAQVARSLAVNATSISELREELIPKLQASVDSLFSKTNDIEVRIALVEGSVRELRSYCDKIDILWQERQQQLVPNEDWQVLSPPSLENRIATDRTWNTIIQSTEWRTVNFTQWEPTRYATSAQLCPNPRRQWENVIFDVKRNGRPHRHYGDIWIDCSGEIVMVLKAWSELAN